MRLVYVLGSRRKYQNKIAKVQYEDMKHQRRAQKRAAGVARWQAMSPAQRKVTVVVSAVILLIVVLVGSLSHSGTTTSYSLCKQIMIQKATLEGSAAGATSGGLPDSCGGLSVTQMASIDRAVRSAVRADG